LERRGEPREGLPAGRLRGFLLEGRARQAHARIRVRRRAYARAASPGEPRFQRPQDPKSANALKPTQEQP
jgi:hypothetical protein